MVRTRTLRTVLFLHQGTGQQGSATSHGGYQRGQQLSPEGHRRSPGITHSLAHSRAIRTQIPGMSGAGMDSETWLKHRWTCPVPSCEYTTHCESKLKMHYRKHTGEKPFTCPYCTFKSAQKGNLNVHIKKCHSAFMENKGALPNAQWTEGVYVPERLPQTEN